MRTRAEPHISFFFTNNIVLFDSGILLGSDWSGGKFIMDQNLYFDGRSITNGHSISFAGKNFSDWQKSGRDTHSIIAEPQFVSAEKFDFRLSKSSPARKLGFKPIDARSVGPRK